jgi:hypothetical protein
MVVIKKLGVRLGGSATSQQVFKTKIDGAPRKREATPESAVWQATSQKNEKWRTPAPPFVSLDVKKTNPRLYFVVKVAHPPDRRLRTLNDPRVC